MIQIGSRQRGQPAPPHIVFGALTFRGDPGARPWLRLLDDETRPAVVDAARPGSVTWSSLFVKRPDAVVRFDITSDGGAGTDLRWTLLVAEPMPAEAQIGHMRKRMNELINADLRFSFGQ